MTMKKYRKQEGHSHEILSLFKSQTFGKKKEERVTIQLKGRLKKEGKGERKEEKKEEKKKSRK